jgi:hypothetical protein
MDPHHMNHHTPKEGPTPGGGSSSNGSQTSQGSNPATPVVIPGPSSSSSSSAPPPLPPPVGVGATQPPLTSPVPSTKIVSRNVNGTRESQIAPCSVLSIVGVRCQWGCASGAPATLRRMASSRKLASLCLGSINRQMWHRKDFPWQVALLRLAVPSFVEIKLFTIFKAIKEFCIYLILSTLFHDAALRLAALWRPLIRWQLLTNWFKVRCGIWLVELTSPMINIRGYSSRARSELRNVTTWASLVGSGVPILVPWQCWETSGC